MNSNPVKIPNKSLFKIEEVCELIDVKPYVLRFWESEFTEIKPLASSNGQKICLLYTSPSPRDRQKSRMPSSA